MSTKEIINEYLYSMSDYESDNYKDKEKLYKKMKKAFLARYVSKLDLEDFDNPVKVETNPLPIDSWECFSSKQLLNSNKTKFVSN